MNIECICFVVLLLGSQSSVANREPFFVWPLAPLHPDAEIACSGQSSIGTTGCLTSASGHPYLDYNGLKLGGSFNSYLELTLNLSILIKDFSLMFFVSPVGDTGTVLQYEKQSMNSGSGEIKMFTISYNHQTIYFDVKGDNLTDTLLNISLVTYFSSNHWTPITVSYSQGSEEFEIFAGDVSIDNELKRQKPLLGLPGKIKIGGTFRPENNPYLGRITCLQFYDHKTSDDNFDNALPRCLSNLWPPSLSALPGNSLPSCDSKKGYFKFVSNGKPSVSCLPIVNLSTTSKIKCANACMLPTNACVSFSINIQDKTCSLFDVDASSNLIGDENVRYYVSNSLTGCC